ncbi:serine/threonine protein kinase [Nocardioides sp. zg-DK7169]|uniref:serine/threonine protein kinase n=1 Tax=Nocardioides sp. zg-DK7169 TaxID=2736600 RepID=UPI0015566DA6|nr:serine/threonine protein kinase [Nocardioides sp. zg-DK7169]NPC98802.1 serine/threonine protein kinase [Nocardioides sp. zg-DK7169]
MTTSPGSGPGSFVDDARRYRLESRIATGGMGVVWRASDTTLHREVAIKVLKAEYADDAGFRSRFATEAQHAAALHHPGIASVYDFGEAHPDDGSGTPRPYLVMELVDGRPLSDLLRAGQPLDPDAARDLLAQAAAALGAAHAAGIVHRDVKPANLLVTPDRRIKVTDFGIARASDSVGLTQTGQVMGTPQYLSPEQARGEVATPASDVYSLGVVAYECLAGRRPFQADTPVATALAHLREPVPELPGSVPPALARVVRRALEKDPVARFPDGNAFAAALRDPAAAADQPTQLVGAVPPGEQTQVLSTGATPLPTPTQGTPLADPDEDEAARRRRIWVPLLVVLLVVALAVAAYVLLSGDNDGSPDDDRPNRPTNTATREPRETTSPSERPSPTETPTEDETTAPPTTSAPPTTEPPAPETVSVVAGDYVGRDVAAVESALRGLGLEVTLEEADNPGDRPEGVVVSVSPSGDVERGSRVTVRYWGAPPATPTQTPRTPSSSAPTDTTPEPSEGGTTG